MKKEVERIFLAASIPLFILFILYALKILEIGMDWDFTRLGIYPRSQRGVFGIFAHTLIHSSFKHLFANTLPFFFLSWCLFFFYRKIAPYIFFFLWVVGGIITFIIGKPGWHVGASGLIYGLAFYLFFSGILRKHVPLIAISLLVTFLYGGLVWNMLPFFARSNTSWEGHLSGAIVGTLAALLFKNFGPQKPDPFKNETLLEENEEHNTDLHNAYLNSLTQKEEFKSKTENIEDNDKKKIEP